MLPAANIFLAVWRLSHPPERRGGIELKGFAELYQLHHCSPDAIRARHGKRISEGARYAQQPASASDRHGAVSQSITAAALHVAATLAASNSLTCRRVLNP